MIFFPPKKTHRLQSWVKWKPVSVSLLSLSKTANKKFHSQGVYNFYILFPYFFCIPSLFPSSREYNENFPFFSFVLLCPLSLTSIKTIKKCLNFCRKKKIPVQQLYLPPQYKCQGYKQLLLAASLSHCFFFPQSLSLMKFIQRLAAFNIPTLTPHRYGIQSGSSVVEQWSRYPEIVGSIPAQN